MNTKKENHIYQYPKTKYSASLHHGLILNVLLAYARCRHAYGTMERFLPTYDKASSASVLTNTNSASFFTSGTEMVQQRPITWMFFYFNIVWAHLYVEGAQYFRNFNISGSTNVWWVIGHCLADAWQPIGSLATVYRRLHVTWNVPGGRLPGNSPRAKQNMMIEMRFMAKQKWWPAKYYQNITEHWPGTKSPPIATQPSKIR